MTKNLHELAPNYTVTHETMLDHFYDVIGTKHTPSPVDDLDLDPDLALLKMNAEANRLIHGKMKEISALMDKLRKVIR